jgi:general secretion pathway protein I
LFRSRRPSEIGAAGFTLIEALAALAIASAGIAAIGSLLFSSSRSDLNAERHVALIAAAQKIVAGLPARNELADGQLSGVLDNHRWRVEAGPFASASAAPVDRGGWEAQRIALGVRSPGGAVVDLDTVRLRKRAPQ